MLEDTRGSMITIEAAYTPRDQSARARNAWRSWRSALASAVQEWLPGTDVPEEAAARIVVSHLIRTFWKQRTHAPPPKAPPSDRLKLPFSLRVLLNEGAAYAGQASLIEAAYLLSSIYADLLPSRVRAQRGAFYTPPPLAERLLDLAAAEGVDWATARVLDPACGGGAFLLPVAHRVLSHHRIASLSAEAKLEHLATHLVGIEIDSFSAWMTRTFLSLLTQDLVSPAGKGASIPIREADTLVTVKEAGHDFDLVIGNPPYGRIALGAEQRALFERSLFGHANAYGVFLDSALRWRAPRGLVAFVTPTSFLGGRYFSKLRALLLREAPPVVLDIVHERTGVFESVQQETCLAIFGSHGSGSTVVNLLSTSANRIRTRRAGTFQLGEPSGAPWLLPRTPEQAVVVSAASVRTNKLANIGYKASTGPLVWNRHKDRLRSSPERGALPLIWAEAVKAEGFKFDYRDRADVAFFSVIPEQDHFMVLRESCVLVQRTTAKEQNRRIIACTLPEEFLHQWGGVVVENHVNVLRGLNGCTVSPRALATVLNTRIIDLLFRCLSGSVAVSATELEALPLPPKSVFEEVEGLLEHPMGNTWAVVEKLVETTLGAGSLD